MSPTKSISRNYVFLATTSDCGVRMFSLVPVFPPFSAAPNGYSKLLDRALLLLPTAHQSDPENRELHTHVTQYLALLDGELPPRLADLVSLPPPHKRHPPVVHLHRQTQFPELLDHAHRMSLDLRPGQRHGLGTHRARPRKVFHAQFRKVPLDGGCVLIGAEYPHRPRQPIRQTVEVVRILVLGSATESHLQELVLAQEQPTPAVPSPPASVDFVVVVLHRAAPARTAAEVKPHVLEVVRTHVLVGEEVDAIAGVDGRSYRIYVLRLVLPRLLGGLGQRHWWSVGRSVGRVGKWMGGWWWAR